MLRYLCNACKREISLEEVVSSVMELGGDLTPETPIAHISAPRAEEEEPAEGETPEAIAEPGSETPPPRARPRPPRSSGGSPLFPLGIQAAARQAAAIRGLPSGGPCAARPRP